MPEATGLKVQGRVLLRDNDLHSASLGAWRNIISDKSKSTKPQQKIDDWRFPRGKSPIEKPACRRDYGGLEQGVQRRAGKVEGLGDRLAGDVSFVGVNSLLESRVAHHSLLES